VLGTTFEHDGKVYLERTCPQHGTVVALVSSDRRSYWLRGEVPHPPPAEGACCGPGPAHRTCIALLEITEACNLTCPACYAESPSGRHVPIAELKERLAVFLKERGTLDVLQLSGGEPTVHPEFLEILAHVHASPDVKHVMVNTNGLLLPKLAADLARLKPRLELYLQMDGFDAKSHVALRGKDLVDEKRRAIAAIVEHDLPTTLVCTVVKGVNDGELAAILDHALAIPTLRGVTFQPATYSGRFTLDATALSRTTLADVLEKLEEQTAGRFRRDDFRPLPCSDPNCCSFTFAARPPGGEVVPLTRLIDYDAHVEKLQDRMYFTPPDAGEARPPDAVNSLFRVVVKPFMDAHTYDQDRVDECCLHIIRPDGRGVSFCKHNVLERGRGAHAIDPRWDVVPPKRRPSLKMAGDAAPAACCAGDLPDANPRPDVIPPDFEVE
jgi:hypothetical protein